MTDINTELERIADETLGNPLAEAQDNLDSKGDPRAAMKGATHAKKEAAIAGGTPGGETQDMGPAVAVSYPHLTQPPTRIGADSVDSASIQYN